jgi:hypothetical protein
MSKPPPLPAVKKGCRKLKFFSPGWLELLPPSGVDEPPVQSSSRGEL